MDDANAKTNYSAAVDLWLESESHGRIRLSQVSKLFVIADQPVDIPPSNASVIVTIDGRTYKRSVRLVHGMSSTRRDAMVEPY
jgi:hypothetical protein